MEMFFLSYVKETKYLLWNLPSFKMVPPKTFLLFSILGLIIAQNQHSYQIKPIFISTVLWLRDDIPCAILSQKCILWERAW